MRTHGNRNGTAQRCIILSVITTAICAVDCSRFIVLRPAGTAVALGAGESGVASVQVESGADDQASRGNGQDGPPVKELASSRTVTPGALQFQSSSHVVTEGLAQLRLRVTRGGGSVGAISADYATADGSAVAGSDYHSKSGTLDFGDGVISRDITITLIDDADAESIETFTVMLTGLDIGAPATCTVTISDDNVTDAVWHSYDLATSGGLPQAILPDQAGVVQAEFELYESTNEGGVDKGALFGTFTAGVHTTFNDTRDYWHGGGYPYIGKSTAARGADTGEVNTPAPAGVMDIAVHPSDNNHLTVAAFIAPLRGDYAVSDLAVRRLVTGTCGQRVRLSVFDQNRNLLNSLEAGINTNDGAWTVDDRVYALGTLQAGDRIYFGIDRVDDFFCDAAEMAWTITLGTLNGPPIAGHQDLQADEGSRPGKLTATDRDVDPPSYGVGAPGNPSARSVGGIAPASADQELRDFWDSEYSRLNLRRFQARAVENTVPILRDGKASLKGRPSFPYQDNHCLIWDTDRDAIDIVLRRTRALIDHLNTLRDDNALTALDQALAELEAKGRDLPLDTPARRTLYSDACALRRTIALANPLLDFDDIIFVACGMGIGVATDRAVGLETRRGSHWQYMAFQSMNVQGDGLMILSDWKTANPGLRHVLTSSQRRNRRFHSAFDVSFDGKKVLYAAQCITKDRSSRFPPETEQHDLGQGPTHVFKVDLDDPNPVKLTHRGHSNGFPCWLPNGRIAYVCDYVPNRDGSGWSRKGDRCGGWGTALWSMKADGSDAFPISWHETAELHPVVDHDGKIVYSRWDYLDRNWDSAHHLWTCYADGRDPRAPHGNYPYPHHRLENGPEGGTAGDGRAARPWAEIHIRPIPDAPGKYVAIAGAHHRVLPGVPIVIDTNVEDDNRMSQVRLLAGTDLPHEGQGVTPYRPTDEYYSPWPLSADYYLMTTTSRILLVDKFGNEVLIYQWENASDRGYLLAPRPLRSRRVPPDIPTQTYQGERSGTPGHRRATILVTDVYESDDEWPSGTEIKSLRILQYVPRPFEYTAWHVQKRVVLGTVPVEADGSAYFEAPVERLIYFQALDQDDLAVQSMRSGTYVHPGEQLTCTGCHERRFDAPSQPSQRLLALQRPPSAIKPEVSGSNPFSYEELVYDDVFQKTCLDCHQREGKGITDFGFNGIDEWRYDQKPSGPLAPYLWRAQARHGFFQTPHGAHRYIPGRFGARESRLGRIMLGEHRSWVSQDEFHRVMLWLDANSTYSSVYTAGRAYPLLEYDPKNPTGVESHRPSR